MLKDIARMLGIPYGQPPVRDPSSFGDPVAERTSWKPCNSGGASFRTHKLVKIDHYRVEFRMTAGAWLFGSFFIVMGAGAGIGVTLGQLWVDGEPEMMALIIPAAVGTLFIGVGIYMLRNGNRPIVFDRRKGYYWKGRTEPVRTLNRQSLPDTTRLSDIHALQVIPEYCRSDKNSYYSYELNLVLRDGKRLNVVDHGKKTALRRDAETLGEFLGRAVWDGTIRN